MLGMERQTGPGRPERRSTSMKAALAAASDGGYYVGCGDGSAGPGGPAQWESLAVTTEAAESAGSGCFAGVSMRPRAQSVACRIVVPRGGACNPPGFGGGIQNAPSVRAWRRTASYASSAS